MTKEEFAAHMVENPADFYYGVLWNKLFRRDIVEKYHLRMDEQISWCEDFMFNLEYIRHAEVFYALQVPIYYYVKTKGSLASQGMNISKTISMKRTVFEYYNNFYKHVLDEEDYEKNRLQIYRFLIDAAGDGSVAPVILSGTKKLGEERSLISEGALNAEGILMDEYRDRKLLDYYLESVAQKNNLSLPEIRLLLCLNQPHHSNNRKELADFARLSMRALSVLLQKLISKNLIKIEDKRSKKTFMITFLPAALPILEELENAQTKYDQARFNGFTEEELIQYSVLSEKIKQNVKNILV